MQIFVKLSENRGLAQKISKYSLKEKAKLYSIEKFCRAKY